MCTRLCGWGIPGPRVWGQGTERPVGTSQREASSLEERPSLPWAPPWFPADRGLDRKPCHRRSCVSLGWRHRIQAWPGRAPFSPVSGRWRQAGTRGRGSDCAMSSAHLALPSSVCSRPASHLPSCSWQGREGWVRGRKPPPPVSGLSPLFGFCGSSPRAPLLVPK